MKRKRIVIIGTLDTKWKEIEFMKDLIRSRGHEVVIIDMSMGGDSPIKADISCFEVAVAGGSDISHVRRLASTERFRASKIMISGVITKAKELWKESKLDGVVGIGGVSSALMASNVMKSLPFGVAKLIVTSAASIPAYSANFIGTSDIMMMHTVVDISGSNRLVRNVLERAAGAICGMVETQDSSIRELIENQGRLIIALTEFGFCEKAAKLIMKYLEHKGFEVVAFHAQGVGDRAMENLIMDGLFDGVIDLVPAGVSEEIFGGNRASGPQRLEAAGKVGIPQVISPCGFDMISCGPLSRKNRSDDPLWASRDISSRKLYVVDELRVQARTTIDEVREIARIVAKKLNKSHGPVKFLIPTKGWSSLSITGGPLYEPNVDATFVDELKLHLRPEIEIRQLNCDLNSPQFARAAVDAMLKML